MGSLANFGNILTANCNHMSFSLMNLCVGKVKNVIFERRIRYIDIEDFRKGTNVRIIHENTNK